MTQSAGMELAALIIIGGAILLASIAVYLAARMQRAARREDRGSKSL